MKRPPLTTADLAKLDRFVDRGAIPAPERELLRRALEELRSHRRGAEALSQALNEGDGTYRP